MVSIIIVSHNYERFVGRAIASAFGQTYRPIEVILVDDGSTDGSQQILAAFSDKARVILKSRGGETSTVNAGFAASHGEIVMFLDADDMLHERAAAAVVDAWRPGLAKVQYCLSVVDAEDGPWGRCFPRYPAGFTPRRLRRQVQRFGTYPAPPSTGNAFARTFLAKVMPLDTTLFPFAPDGALNAIAPLYGDVVSIDRPLGYYRVHGRNMWATTRLDPARLLSFIELGRKEAEFMRAHALQRGVRLSRRNPLDHAFHQLERRLAACILTPTHPAVARDRRLLLFWRACCCAHRHEKGLRLRLALLAWFLATAISPPRLARRLLDYRFSEAARPARVRSMVRRLSRNAT